MIKNHPFHWDLSFLIDSEGSLLETHLRDSDIEIQFAYLKQCKHLSQIPSSLDLRPLLTQETIFSAECRLLSESQQEYSIAWNIHPYCSLESKKILFYCWGKFIDYHEFFHRVDPDIVIETLLNNIPYLIFWKNVEGVYMGANLNFTKMVGFFQPKDLIGKTDYDLNWGEGEADFFRQIDRRVMSGERHVNQEELVSRPDGSRITMLNSKVPLMKSQDECIGILGISVDISDRKLAEQALIEAKKRAEIANEAKSNFLAIVSHELRTPLNVILGMAQVLRMRLHQKEENSYVESICQSGVHLLSLINDLLDVSKLEAGKMEITEIPIEFQSLIQEVFNDFSNESKKNMVKFILNYDDKIPKTLMIDVTRLKQILHNLLSNAFKFTEKGRVILSVTFESKTEHTLFLKISVKDTGVGIPPDKIDVIFDNFIQVDSSYERRYQGTGLGLSITKQLVSLMDGKLYVQSKIGLGSTFVVEIPCRYHNESAQSEKTLFKTTTTPYQNMVRTHSQFKVLLVEDNLLNQKVVALMLQNMDVELTCVDNGYQAIELVNQVPFGLILLDIGLPDINGVQVAKHIRERSKYPHVPIVALTAHVLESDRQNFFQAGINDIVVKPIMMDELHRMLEKWHLASSDH